jgi:hypothetical protein
MGPNMARKHVISVGGDNQDWRTDPVLFGGLDDIFDFTVDACASSDNHLCKRWWSDCTKEDWSGEIVFCNPPFRGTGKILPLARKATTAVFLLPFTALDTVYFHKHPPSVIAIPGWRWRYWKDDIKELLKEHKKSDPYFVTLISVYGQFTDQQLKGLKELGCMVYGKLL